MRQALRSPFVSLVFFVCAAASPADVSNDGSATYTVSWSGEMRRVHLDGDASPTVELGAANQGEGSFALGPLAGLRGEITAVDGKVYVSRVKDGREVISHDWIESAPFLVYGRVTQWVEVAVPESVRTVQDLEGWLPGAALAVAIDPESPFPFKVKSGTSRIEYHVMANDAEGDRITRPHDELKRRFVCEAEPATLVGVHSRHHAGVFTHHGSTTHIHFVSDDECRSGHVDVIQLGAGSHAYLPSP